MKKIVLIRSVIKSSPPVFDRSANDDGDDDDDGVVAVALALALALALVLTLALLTLLDVVILSTSRQAAPTSYRLSFLLVPPFYCALVRSQIHYGL